MLLLLAGCNQYELFVTFDGQSGRADAVDLLFVIDNSESMREESLALAESFTTFVTELDARGDAYADGGLGSVVDAYVDSWVDPGAFVDFQLALTTIDAAERGGALLGEPSLLAKGDPGLVDAFVRPLLCEATCFGSRDLVPDDPDVTCDAPYTGDVSAQALDCLCGEDAWIGNCGGAKEEGLESVYQAMCRAVEEPPPDCFLEGAVGDGANAGLLRPGATLIPVIVSDEGDASRRVPTVRPDPGPYRALLGAFDVPITWVVVTEALTADDEVACGQVTTSAGYVRYEVLAEDSGGLKLDIHATDCGPNDWSQTLRSIGDLVADGSASFPLDPAPVEDSIVVEVGSRAVDRSDEDGWTWRADEGLLVLRGDAAPEANEVVRIWYQPKRGR